MRIISMSIELHTVLLRMMDVFVFQECLFFGFVCLFASAIEIVQILLIWNNFFQFSYNAIDSFRQHNFFFIYFYFDYSHFAIERMELKKPQIS